MKLPKPLYLLPLLSFGICASAVTPIVKEISPYVYPSNVCYYGDITAFMPDGENYAKSADGGTKICTYSIKTGELISTIFDASNTRETKIDSFETFSISPDGNKIILGTDIEPVYRRSSKGTYYIYDSYRRILRPLSRLVEKQQSPCFSPDSRMVSFVADNNIYLRKLDYDTEIKVTEDGEYGKIINGITDWTYEEEFSYTEAMSWSPDSETLCYVSFNETDVPTYSFPIYEGSCDPRKEFSLYPGTFSYKYPVAGMNNSAVSLKSYDIATRKTKELTIADKISEYIPTIRFAPDGKLIAGTLNRDQNHFELYSINPKSTISKLIYSDKTSAWIDPVTYENLVITNNSIIINSAKTGFNNLYEIDFNGTPVRTVTDLKRDVSYCYGKDTEGNVYFQSVGDSPIDKVICCASPKETKIISEVTGVTNARFSPTMKYCLLTRSDANTPPYGTITDNKGKKVRQAFDNREKFKSLPVLPKKEFMTVKSEGIELNAYIIKPTDFDPSRRYPVIMTQYSGPGSQTVLNKWSLDWEQFAAGKGYIVVCVDGRGTGGRGRDFMTVVYKNLGHYETIDQINAAKQVASFPYVDPDRIGICGWSYGGYETLMCITAENSPFRAAVAIAPVTDWRYYDTVYAERYMLTPQQNEEGYKQSAPINRTDKLACPLLIMSGTADDNVHLSNSMEFVSRLQQEGTLCDMLLFPNMNHSINGCNSRAAVYCKMIQFFNQNL